MVAMAFDTFKFIRTLTQSGLTEAQAAAISEAVGSIHETADLVTKTDAHITEMAIRSDMEKMETAIRNDMAKMEAAIRSDMVKMEARIDAVEAKIDAVEARMEAKIDALEQRVSAKIDAVEAKIELLGKSMVIKLGSLLVVGLGVSSLILGMVMRLLA